MAAVAAVAAAVAAAVEVAEVVEEVTQNCSLSQFCINLRRRLFHNTAYLHFVVSRLQSKASPVAPWIMLVG